MRLVLAALAGLAFAVVPALAADHSVKSATGNRWEPATIEIVTGDKVIWTNGDGGFHNVSFEDGFTEPAEPAPAWPDEVSRTFDKPGTYAYVCQAHSSMQGTVVVQAPSTTTTTTTAPTTTTPSSDEPAPLVVKRLRAVFRRRVALRVNSDRARVLAGVLRRRGRRFGTVRLRVREGTQVVRFSRTRSGRRLARGRYSLTVRGATATIRFRVR